MINVFLMFFVFFSAVRAYVSFSFITIIFENDCKFFNCIVFFFVSFICNCFNFFLCLIFVICCLCVVFFCVYSYANVVSVALLIVKFFSDFFSGGVFGVFVVFVVVWIVVILNLIVVDVVYVL